jgi:hypothetical protein
VRRVDARLDGARRNRTVRVAHGGDLPRPTIRSARAALEHARNRGGTPFGAPLRNVSAATTRDRQEDLLVAALAPELMSRQARGLEIKDWWRRAQRAWWLKRLPREARPRLVRRGRSRQPARRVAVRVRHSSTTRVRSGPDDGPPPASPTYGPNDCLRAESRGSR